MQNTQDKRNAKNNRRGQAALEFMVTYGWAIMAATIVIGALSYYGVFNTQRYTRDVCFFGDQLPCEDNIAYSNNGSVKFMLRNNLGADINVSRVLIKSDYGVAACNSPSLFVSSGSIFEISCTPNARLPPNNKFKYSAVVTFARNGSINYHNQTGDVTTTVR
ncbi:MAG TPA: hypothetical protein VEC16_04775 [Alphaproteobacteria bacterium]|nr:hypothetical protein [Alphaproteobacteria bacterium]